MKTKDLMIIAATALLIGAMSAQEASAQTQSWASGTAAPLGFNDLIPRMSSGNAYTERYTFSVDLDQGGHVGMHFTISNLGLGSGYGAAEVNVRWPGKEQYKYAERVSRRKWSYEQSRFAMDISNTQVEAQGDNVIVLRHQGKDVKVELRFENRIPMWRPGTGEVRNGDDYYRFTLISPRADVTGRIFIDGEWHEVTGRRQGYGDHVATNVAPYDLAKRFTRFRDYNDDLFVMWREIELTERYGGQVVSWIVVGIGDEIVYQDAAPGVQFGNLERDKETSYNIPYAAQVNSEREGAQLRFLLRGEGMRRRDLLQSYGRIARAVAGRFAKPFEYNISGDYALEVEVGGRRLRTTGTSHYTVDFVNP